MEFVAHRANGECEVDGCTHYSDCDVYFKDGTCLDMCSMHSWDACDEYHKDNSINPIIQVVPQHGGDINREILASRDADRQVVLDALARSNEARNDRVIARSGLSPERARELGLT